MPIQSIQVLRRSVQAKAALVVAAFLAMTPATIFAGQSLLLTNAQLSLNDPNLSQTQSWRVEFQLHNWTLPTAGSPLVFALDGTGAYARLSPNGTLAIETRDSVSRQQPCFVTLTGLTNVLVRFQKDVTNMRFSCELWSYNGGGYNSQFDTVTTLRAGSSGGYINSGISGSLGFLRISNTLLPLGSKPPTTADAGNLTELKFDGNLKDSSGKGHSAAGSASFVATPNQVTVAIAKTAGAPAWSLWTSLRAGFPAQLDASASYSLADASSAVTCFWQELNGPSMLRWSNGGTLTPTVTGLVFGTYNFALQVTDAAGSKSTATLQVGAVATDDKGVVVNADPNVDLLFGPMIAFGKNPWGYQDYWQMHAMNLRAADYVQQGWGPVPQWEKTGAGTVSYYWNGVGIRPGSTSVNLPLAAAISATSLAIPVANAAALNWSELPTRILIAAGLFPNTAEEVRICSVTGNTLNVCYDGRGQNASNWNAGALVGQSKLVGAGTHFLTDPTAPVCPLGASAPPGPASYSAGSVSLSAGSTAVTGTGTAWTNAMAGSYLRVAATHAGTSFYFLATVSAVNGPSSLTLNRPYPLDADAGAYSYAILQGNRTLVLRYPHQVDPGGVGELLWGTTGCESETAVYMNPFRGGNSMASGHDTPLDGTLIQSQPYSVTDTSGWVNQSSTGGINFYGESLASRSLYYRSGLTTALNAANTIDDYWIKSPWANADGNGYPRLFLGGGGVGAFAAGILTGRVNWSDLRGYAAMGETMMNGIDNNGTANCEYADTRDGGYAATWLILGAMFDPDQSQNGFRSRWRNGLATMQKNDNACKRSDGSWANGFLWNSNTGPVTVIHGSTAVTGTNLPPNVCVGTGMGTAAVVNGSATINSTFGSFAGAPTLILNGTMGGNPFTASYAFSGTAAAAGTLAALWPGDTGTVSWMAVNVTPANNNALTVIASGNSDYSNLSVNFGCIWNSATSLTLDHPWQGNSGSNYFVYSSNLAGFGQQPYMLGIKTFGMHLLASSTDPALSGYASVYSGYAKLAAQWLHDKGFDPVTQGLHYGRGFGFCEPLTTPSANPQFEARTPGCNYGLRPEALVAARQLNAELANAASILYAANPTADNQNWGDKAYGSLWGYGAYTTGGAYADASSPTANLSYSNMTDSYIHQGKWYGFFSGMGVPHSWPAARLGGVAAPQYRTMHVSFEAPADSVSAKIAVTAPSGAVSVSACGAKICDATVDARQGSHWFQIQYLSNTGKIVSQSEPDLFQQNR